MKVLYRARPVGSEESWKEQKSIGVRIVQGATRALGVCKAIFERHMHRHFN